MEFNYREFLMRGLRDAVGKLPDHKVILNAGGFYEKGVLMQEDLQELDRLIAEKNNPTPKLAEELPDGVEVGANE